MTRKTKPAFLRVIEERRREEAARWEQPEEASETEAPVGRVLQEWAPHLWPTKPRRRPWK